MLTIRKTSAILLIALASTFTTVAHAEQQHEQSGYHAEMTSSMQKMEREMKAVPMTGNPDVDFAAMMIPHHQGAIYMAEVQLKYGKDEKLRSLAKEIIEAQKKEIKDMQDRLKELKATDPSTSAPSMMSHHNSMPHHQ